MPIALVLRLAAKDLKLRIRDRSAILIGFVAPVLLTVITSVAFADFGQGGTGRLAFVDHDGGVIADAIRDELTSEEVSAAVEFQDVATVEEATRRLVDVQADVAIVIPPGFSSDALAGNPTRLTVIQAEGRIEAGAIAKAFIDDISAQIDATQRSVQAALAIEPDLNVEELTLRSSNLRLPVTIQDVETGRTGVDAASYFGPSMAVLFLFFTVSFGARSLMADRDDGTLARTLSAPVPAWVVLASKAVFSLLLGVLSMVSIWTVTTLLFGTTWGDPLGVAALIVVIALATTAVMALVASFARTSHQVEGLSAAVAFTLALIGGNFVRVHQLPEPLYSLSAFTPNGWALRGFSDLVALGGSVGSILAPLLAIAVFATVAGSVTVARASRWVTP